MSTREELLYALEKADADGTRLSGEELAAKLGVSRAAVWKAAKQLKDEGVGLLAVRGKGYALKKDCPLLSEGRIRAHLPPELSGMDVFVYDETDSTNRRAKAFADGKGFCRALFCADAQTQGRGRLGRSFYSPAGSGLYMTYLFSSALPLEKLSAVTPYAAVITARALETECGVLGVGIKWVNDLYLAGKKICGILTEAVTDLESGGKNGIAVGIGINLTTDVFPDDLRAKAGNVGKMPNRCALAARIASALYGFEKDPFDRTHMEEYTARSTVLGKTVTLDRWGEKTTGTVVGFDRDGGLLLDVGEKDPVCPREGSPAADAP